MGLVLILEQLLCEDSEERKPLRHLVFRTVMATNRYVYVDLLHQVKIARVQVNIHCSFAIKSAMWTCYARSK